MNMFTMFSPAALLMLALSLSACGGSKTPDAAAKTEKTGEAGHADAAVHAEQVVKGPHGGRLLSEGDFALEVSIFEDGGRPEFRIYPSVAGKPVALRDVQVTMALRRINGQPNGVTDRHSFAPNGDHLLSAAEVYEPHSFDVTVKARYADQNYAWHYDSPEGEVEIAADIAKLSGLKVAAAGEGRLHQTLSLYGAIQPNPEQMRDVTARFPGPVRSVAVKVGDTVSKGQTLATIESNESLQVYTLTAPIAGTLTARNTNPGELAGSQPLFEIADFSTVRAELNVFPRDRGALQIGQTVSITAADGTASGEGSISFVAPVGRANQALIARVLLDNSTGQWTPGQFINAAVTVGIAQVPLVVPMTALQGLRDWDVVFVSEGEKYQAQPVELGRSDGKSVEVLSGVTPGAHIVVENSYLVKADIEKSGAAHEH